MTKHAVLYVPDTFMPPASLMWIDKGKIIDKALPDSPYTYIDVYNLAMRHALTTIWIYPNYGEITPIDTVDSWNVFTSYADEEKTQPKYARIFHRGTYGTVEIAFPVNGGWNWTLDAPLDILATVNYLEQELGVPVQWSSGHVATELVKHLNRTAKRQTWVRPETVNPFSLPIMGSAKDLYFSFPLAPDTEGMYLHQYDKKSAYLAACLDLFVGAGDAIHIIGENVIDTKLPGIYRVTATLPQKETFIDRFLLPLFQGKWVTQDILEYALYKGYQVTIHEAHQWLEKHKTLTSYAEKLYMSRNAFKDVEKYPHKNGRENAERTLKDIALRAGGKFASKNYSTFKHPYWFMAMVGKNYTTMLAHINKVLEVSGQVPVLGYVDSLYYLSTESNPVTACPALFTCGRANGMGKFKHEGSWKVTPELIHLFNTSKAPGNIVELLNEAWENK